MTIRFDRDFILDITGWKELPNTLNVLPQGLAVELNAISGGEIFLTKSLEEAEQALSLGCTLALYEQGQISNLDTCVQVKSISNKLRQIAAAARKQSSAKLIVLIDGEEVLLCKELLAKLLLQNSRGFAQLHRPASEIKELAGLCEVGEQHDWVVLSLNSTWKESDKLLAQLSPDLIVLCDRADSSLSEHDKFLLEGVERVYLDRSAPNVCYRSTSGHRVSLDRVQANGVDPLSVELSINDQKHAIETKLKGGSDVPQVLAAVCAAMCENSKLDLVSSLSSFQPAVSRPIVGKLGDGRKIIDFIDSNSLTSFKNFFKVLQSEVSKGEKVALVLGPLPNEVTLEQSYYVDKLAELDLLCLALVGRPDAVLVEALEKYNRPVFNCDSAESAAHTIGKVAFSTLFVKGEYEIGLNCVMDTLIYSFGESLEVPVIPGNSQKEQE